MKHLTEAEYKEKLKVLKEKNVQKKYRKNLRKEKFKYAPKLKIETNKLFAIYLFILLNAIVIYAMVAIISRSYDNRYCRTSFGICDLLHESI